jgi:hypothetical protein
MQAFAAGSCLCVIPVAPEVVTAPCRVCFLPGCILTVPVADKQELNSRMYYTKGYCLTGVLVQVLWPGYAFIIS